MERSFVKPLLAFALILPAPAFAESVPAAIQQEAVALTACMDNAVTEESQKASPDPTTILDRCQTEYLRFQIAVAPNATTQYKNYLNTVFQQAAAQKLNDAIEAAKQ